MVQQARRHRRGDITYAPTSSCMYDGPTLAFDLMTLAGGEAGIWR